MNFKNIYWHESFGKEILRVLVFLLIIAFYISSVIGIIIGSIHLLLAITNPRQYGMSRILIKMLPGE